MLGLNPICFRDLDCDQFYQFFRVMLSLSEQFSAVPNGLLVLRHVFLLLAGLQRIVAVITFVALCRVT